MTRAGCVPTFPIESMTASALVNRPSLNSIVGAVSHSTPLNLIVGAVSPLNYNLIVGAVSPLNFAEAIDDNFSTLLTP